MQKRTDPAFHSVLHRPTLHACAQALLRQWVGSAPPKGVPHDACRTHEYCTSVRSDRSGNPASIARCGAHNERSLLTNPLIDDGHVATKVFEMSKSECMIARSTIAHRASDFSNDLWPPCGRGVGEKGGKERGERRPSVGGGAGSRFDKLSRAETRAQLGECTPFALREDCLLAERDDYTAM